MSHSREMKRIAFAGNGDISVKALEFIMGQNIKPLALLLVSNNRASHAEELRQKCSYLEPTKILKGKEFAEEKGKNLLQELALDYIISIHFPYIYPKEVLDIPKHGTINLHPAYLPYNRGWHTASWAIEKRTPFGATLHFMDETIDTGDIIYQKELEIQIDDTAHTLYQRVKELELEIFKEAWPILVSGNYVPKPQPKNRGSIHKKKDIEKLQMLDLDKEYKVEKIIRRLRALTTNKIEEAVYFKINGQKYRVQISVQKEDNK